MLLNQPTQTENQDIDLVSIFEDAFGRSLSQREVQLINSLKCQGFDDEMIVDALNESVKSGVITFRYIEKYWIIGHVMALQSVMLLQSHKQVIMRLNKV